MKRLLSILVFVFVTSWASAQDVTNIGNTTIDTQISTPSTDTQISTPSTDTLISKPTTGTNIYNLYESSLDTLGRKKLHKWLLRRIVDEFNNIDTTYIEPQHFKFQVMLQMTNSFEFYNLTAKDGRKLRFAPDVRSKVGPYIGYSLVFLGYALQLNHLYLGNFNKEFDLTLYTPLLGIDIFYHDNGQDFKINSLTLGDDYDSKVFRGQAFNGFSATQKGFNVYYIFNHHKHSYTATYNQSTRQRRSSGSFIAGLGWSSHKVSVDWQKLDDMVKAVYPDWQSTFTDDQLFDNISYDCYNLSAGYAYNWVPVRNLLIGFSATGGIGYNRTRMDNGEKRPFSLKNVSEYSFTFDGVGRVGVVYNNDRWFAGASMVFHSYSFREANYNTDDVFGSLNFYVGFNFGKKRHYRKHGRFFEF